MQDAPVLHNATARAAACTGRRRILRRSKRVHTGGHRKMRLIGVCNPLTLKLLRLRLRNPPPDGTRVVSTEGRRGNMERRAKGVYAHRAPGRSVCVAMVCSDPSVSGLVSRLLRELGSCNLVLYSRAEDLAMNAPRGGASLVILADDSTTTIVEHSLRWLKRWRPTAAVAVVGVPERPDLELVARTGGASYFVRPVLEAQWRALLEHALAKTSSKAQSRR